MFQSYHNIVKRMAGVGSGSDPSQQQQQQQQPLVEGRDEQQQRRQQDSVSTEYLVHHWLEATFAWFQVIVLWHEPYISVCAISGLLSSFLLLTYFAPRFYATLMLAIFVYNLNKFWFRHVWPSIRVPPSGDRELEQRLDVDRFTYLHPQLMTLEELQYHIRNLINFSERHLQRLLEARHHSPALFCSRLCFLFTCTAYLGHSISGLTLVFSLMVLIMAAPGIYAHLLPEQYKHWLQRQYQSLLLASQSNQDALVHSSQAAPLNDEFSGAKTSNEPATLAYKSKETLAASMATTMKTIETLFGNLKKRPLSTGTRPGGQTGGQALEPEVAESAQASEPSVLASLRQDGAKVLYNLIDVTLMGADRQKQQQQKQRQQRQQRQDATSSAKSHGDDGNNDDEDDDDDDDRLSSSEHSGPSAADTETSSLGDNNEAVAATATPTTTADEDQQDDGFVML